MAVPRVKSVMMPHRVSTVMLVPIAPCSNSDKKLDVGIKLDSFTRFRRFLESTLHTVLKDHCNYMRDRKGLQSKHSLEFV